MRSLNNRFHISACSAGVAPGRNLTVTSYRSESAQGGRPSTMIGAVRSGYARVARNRAGVHMRVLCPLAGFGGGPVIVGRSLVLRLMEATSNSIDAGVCLAV